MNLLDDLLKESGANTPVPAPAQGAPDQGQQPQPPAPEALASEAPAPSGNLFDQLLAQENVQPEGAPAGRPYYERVTDIPGDIGGMFLEGLKPAGEMVSHAVNPQDRSKELVTTLTGKGFSPETATKVAPFLAAYQGAIGLPMMEAAAGLLGTAFSPVMGPIRSMISRPVEEATGIPKEATELVAGVAIGRGPRLSRTPSEPPTVAALRNEADANYTIARSLPIRLHEGAIQAIGQDIARFLQSPGGGAYRTRRIPQTMDEIAELATLRPGGVTIADIEAVRRNLGRTSRTIDPVTRMRTEDAGAASRAIEMLDQRMAGLRPNAVRQGQNLLPELLTQMNNARGNYAGFLRGSMLARELDHALIGAASTGKGGNIENKIRQHFAGIIKNPRKMRLYNAQEQEMIREVAVGNSARNIARMAGMAAPSGIVSAVGTQVLADMFGGRVMKALLPLAGAASKWAAERSAHNAVEAVTRATTARTPLGQSRPPTIQPRGYLAPIAAAHPLLQRIEERENGQPNP